MLSCGNQLAGDPDFGQRKSCRIAYVCGGGKTQELSIQEGEQSTLSCSADVEAKNAAPSSYSTNNGTSRADQSNRAAANSSTSSPAGAASRLSTDAADVQLLRTAIFANDPNLERVTAADGLPDGGFLAATNIRGGSSFIYKISSAGATMWRKDLPDAMASSVGTSTDGTYWIAGALRDKDAQTGQIRLSDFVRRITADGIVSQRIGRSAASESRYFHCAVENDNKFIQIAPVGTLDQYFRMEVPAISMTDGSGARLWEHLVPLDQGRRIEQVPQRIGTCAGILVTHNERILAAEQIFIMPDLKTTDEVLRELDSGIHLRPGTLLMALDLAGRETARVRHDDVTGALLVPAPHGALLLETSHKKPGLSEYAGAIDQQLHIYSFDANLKELKAPMVVDGSYFDTADAAYPTPEGGLLFAGCPGTGGDVFLRYITPAGLASPKRQVSALGFCGGFYRFSPGQRPGEALILVQTPSQGNRLLTVRYVN